MLQVRGLTKSYGARLLFQDVSFSLASGEVVGLVGRNGSGKSTLFRILRGLETADSGDFHWPKSYRLGALEQHIHFTQPTVLEEAVKALPDEQKEETYRAEALLFGLGFSHEDLNRSPQDFSGGYQLRINLVKCLLKQPDLLLLDEPTNYLDIMSMQWMQQFLKSFPGEVILITHDRHFMDAVVTHTMGIHRQSLRKIPGDTSKYYEQLAMDEEIYEKTRLNQEKKAKEMQAFVDRFRAKSSKAKQAQSKLKQIAKLKPMLKLSAEDQLGFRFNYKETPAKRLMDVNQLSFAYKGGVPLFKDLSFQVAPGDCVAIVGRNGYGKTTLLNVLAGQLKGGGEINTHPDTRLAYYQQTNKKKLSPKATIAQEIGSVNASLGTSQVRSICGAMMFSGEQADKKIEVLSGGEQGRVLLGQVIARSCNLLLLDEPTNHLDMESIQALSEEIEAFPGGVIFVSHDEDLLEKLATKLIVFKEGQAQVFLGSYSEFLQKEGWGEAPKNREKKSSGDKKENRRKRAEIIQARSKKLKPIQKSITELENKIISLEEELESKNSLVQEQTLESGDSLQKIFQEIGQIQLSLATAYEELDGYIKQQDRVTSEYEGQLSELDS